MYSLKEKLTSDYFIVGLLIVAFILDAGNGLIPIVPLREIAFLLILGKLFYYYKSGVRDKGVVIFFLISLVIPAYGAILSFLNGTPISQIISDANGYVFLITGLGLAFITFINQNVKEYIIKLVIFCCLLLSGLTILIFVLHIFGIDIYKSAEYLSKFNLGFAGIEVNGEIRIFLRGLIYVMLAYFFLMGNILSRKYVFGKKTDWLMVIIFLITLILSNTRGLWVSSFLGTFILFAFLNGVSFLKDKWNAVLTIFKKRKFISSIIVIIGAIFIFNIFGSYLANSIERITSIVDFSESNQSNNMRKEQSIELLNEFRNQPIFGKGFGSTLDSGYTRSAEAPYSFELSYFELLYKLGVMGFCLFIGGIAIYLYIISKIKDKTVKFVALASVISLLFISSTNPYIVSSLGMFYLAIIYAFTESTYKKYKV